MPEAAMLESELAVWETVRAMNRAWTSGRVEDIAEYFHPDMVAVTQTDRERLVGKVACMDSWRRFISTATIHDWKEHDPIVQIFGNAAVVSYYYELACEIRGETAVLAGRDLLFLVKEGARWLVIADQFSEYPED